MADSPPNTVLIGHDAAILQVAEAFATGRMHHAWLITGSEGVGKATLAHHIAHHVLSNGKIPVGTIDRSHPVSKLITANTHPDLFILGRTRDEKTGELRSTIVVDDALKVAAFLRKTSTHGGWRVVIIDDAHALNRFGQNAILKILEEPPPRVIILITVTTTGALLPTIRSRCRLLSLSPLTQAAMQSVFASMAHGHPITGNERLISLANGSVGLAFRIAETGALVLYDELIKIIDGKPPLDTQRIHKLADQINRKADTQAFEALVTLLQNYMRTQVYQAAMQGQGGAVHKGFHLWDKARQSFAMAEISSLDRKLGLINAISASVAA